MQITDIMLEFSDSHFYFHCKKLLLSSHQAQAQCMLSSCSRNKRSKQVLQIYFTVQIIHSMHMKEAIGALQKLKVSV